MLIEIRTARSYKSWPHVIALVRLFKIPDLRAPGGDPRLDLARRLARTSSCAKRFCA